MATTYPDRLSAIKSRLQATTSDPRACEHTADDVRWVIGEIDFLRLYLSVLGDFALAADQYRWALEEPAPGRVERRRRAFEEARQELLAMPAWRPGECHGGCRRYATHELVIEEGGRIEREPCCDECGAKWLAVKRRAIDAGWAPPAIVRLVPIAQPSREAKEVCR